MFSQVSPPSVAAPQAVNLLASALRPDDESGTGWMDGLVWRPESCPEVQGFGLCEEVEGPPPLGPSALVYGRPVGYRVRVECSTMSGELDRTIATRQAEAVASYVVAQELWTGELSTADLYDTPSGDDQVNPHLASADATTLPAESDLMIALAELEAAARDAARGGPVFLHTPLRLIARVAHNLRRVGNELRTQTDAVVIPDPGYPGTGPAGTGDSWLFATGPVAVRLGPVSADTSDAGTVRRQINSRSIIASRLFVIGFDPCVHFAINTGA